MVSENIPYEAYLTELVQQEKLSDPPSQWAETVMDAVLSNRKDHNEAITAHGFDIRREAEKLQEFYVNAYEKIK